MNTRTMFFRHLAQTSLFPVALEIERAKGIYMYGRDGKRYLDMISGISVSALGHLHPEVIKAVQEQLEKYMHLMVYGEFVQDPQVELAALLTSCLPGSLDNVYLVNSGSEAIEGAMKLAKRYTKRSEIISFYNAYHGSSHGALSVTGNERLKQAFRPLLPGVMHLNYNQVDELSGITERTACVLAETIQGEAGAIVPDHAFLKALRQRCNETGTLLIFDEIQAGMGRTGTMWAFEDSGVIPDVLVLAKSFGGGLPLGAFIAGKQIMECLTDNPVLGHITTFGGNAVCAAAARASLQVILKEKLWENAASMEQILRTELKHPAILEIRGKGLLLAIELDGFEKVKALMELCIARGLVTDWFLFADHCIRIAPPLIITQSQMKEATGIIMECLDQI